MQINQKIILWFTSLVAVLLLAFSVYVYVTYASFRQRSIQNRPERCFPVQKGSEAIGQTRVFGELKPGDVVLKTASEGLADGVPIKTRATR